MRFLDVKTDFAFKKVFGSEDSTDILIDFLNAVLEYPPERTITALTIVDPYQIPLLKGMKDTYVDVKAKLTDGRQVIIEMQVLNVPGFEQRVLFNAAKAYSVQLQKGDDDSLAKQPHIQQAFDIANEAGMSQEELDAQDKRHDFIRLQRGSIEKALQDGLDDTTIASKTGLTEAQVAQLRT